MKLSEIKGEGVIDLIADLVAPIANIAEDKEASELFTRKPLPANMTAGEFMAQRIKTCLPKLLKGHKSDVIDILAAINSKNAEEYKENLTVVSLINDATELLNDPLFYQLFFSQQMNTAGESSVSAAGNTGEEPRED